MLTVGILGCSEIAYRRFLPEVMNMDGISVKAVAEEYNKDKLEVFRKDYGLESEKDFEGIIKRDDINAVYIPQPPALHYKWAKKALEAGKHVLLEKPATIKYEQTKELIELAQNRQLALHENYMFQYHLQIGYIKEIIQRGEIGQIRLIKTAFGFPLRNTDDFRYSRKLGGGALLDAGGYAIKMATLLLGNTVKVNTAQLNYLPGYEVDMFGSATLSNDNGLICQIGFGMDCHYQCSLEIWGSIGRIFTDRIFTAPSDYEPVVCIDTPEKVNKIHLPKDSHFKHSIEEFCNEIVDKNRRVNMYQEMLLQAKLVQNVLDDSENR